MNVLVMGNNSKVILFAFVLGVFLISSCQSDKVCNCSIDKDTLKRNDSLSVSMKTFFKENEFWEKLNEPYLDTLKHEAYRVYRGNFFDEFVKIYKVEQKPNGYQLTIKNVSREVFSGKQDFLPSMEVVYPLSEKKWLEITKKMNEYCFWTMNSKMSKGSCLDEEALLLEGNNPNIKCSSVKSYHIVRGNCVDSLTGYKYFQLCDMLLDLDKEK